MAGGRFPKSVVSPIHSCNRELAVDQDYKLLNQKGTVAEVTTWSDEKEFADMHEALLKLGFSEEQVLRNGIDVFACPTKNDFCVMPRIQRSELYVMLKFVLYLGNISFRPGKEGSEVNVHSNTRCPMRDAGMHVCHRRLLKRSSSKSVLES